MAAKSIGKVINAPNPKILDAELLVGEDAVLNVPKLEKVRFEKGQMRLDTKRIWLFPSATLNAPSLKMVGGTVVLESYATMNAPNLKEVDGDIILHRGATLNAPKLKL